MSAGSTVISSRLCGSAPAREMHSSKQIKYFRQRELLNSWACEQNLYHKIFWRYQSRSSTAVSCSDLRSHFTWTWCCLAWGQGANCRFYAAAQDGRSVAYRFTQRPSTWIYFHSRLDMKDCDSAFLSRARAVPQHTLWRLVLGILESSSSASVFWPPTHNWPSSRLSTKVRARVARRTILTITSYSCSISIASKMTLEPPWLI